MRSIIAALMILASSQSSAFDLDPARQKILDQFRSKAEPTAMDAVWTQPGVFKVGVKPNGRPRDVYADYVCQVIYDSGLKGQKILVRIVDYPNLIRTGKWENIGTALCQ